MRILETRFNTDCGQYRLTFDAQTSLYVMVQIREVGMYQGFVIPVKSDVEYLNRLLKLTITGMWNPMACGPHEAAQQFFVPRKAYMK